MRRVRRPLEGGSNVIATYSGADFLLGFNVAQTTVATIAELANATVAGAEDAPVLGVDGRSVLAAAIALLAVWIETLGRSVQAARARRFRSPSRGTPARDRGCS